LTGNNSNVKRTQKKPKRAEKKLNSINEVHGADDTIKHTQHSTLLRLQLE